MLHFLWLLAIGLIAVEVFAVLTWILYLGVRRLDVVGSFWGVGLIVATIVYSLEGGGDFWRRLLALTVVIIWGLRLVVHTSIHLSRHPPDLRYDHLISKWPHPQWIPFKALLLLVGQGAVIVLLSLPFAIMCRNPSPTFAPLEVFSLFIWMFGIWGVSVADAELAQFKFDCKLDFREEEVCNRGLWRYSRHPNFFFEWIVWIGFAAMAYSSPWGWMALVIPLIVLYLLVWVYGIPPTEEHALATKGDAYRAYQAKTSSFFPWFPAK